MNPVTGLSIGRLVIGIVALLSPALAGKLFRLDVEGQPQLSYLSRMFGSREIALGAVTLAASGATRRNLVLVGIAVDAADAFAGASAGASRVVSRSNSVFLTLPALAAVATGLAVILRKD